MFKQKEKQKTKDELQQEAEKKLAKECLIPFREEYSELVQRYGWIHGIRWTMPTDLQPSMPFVTEVFIRKQLDESKLKKNIQESVEIRN